MRPPRRSTAVVALPALLAVLALSSAAKQRPRPPAAGLGQSRLTAEIMEFRECNASSALVVANWTQRRVAIGDVLVSAHLAVTRTTTRITDAVITFTKCSEYDTHCEKLFAIPGGKRTCSMWQAKNMFWTPVQESISAVQPPYPSVDCPPKQGIYELRDAQMDYDLAARICPFPLRASVWTVLMEAWGADARPYVCLVAKGRLVHWARRPTHNRP